MAWLRQIQSVEEACESLGYVWDNPKRHPPKEKKVWNGFMKCYEIEYQTIEDTSLQFSDHQEIIPTGSCRECFKEITDYKEKFYKKILNGGCTSTLFCKENGYCRECAEKLGRVALINQNAAFVVSHKEIDYGTSPRRVERTVYSDGSVIEYDSEEFESRKKKE